MAKDKNNDIDISASTGESFSPTMLLRRLIKMRKDGSNLPLSDTLQQAWQGSSGNIEWIDVSTIIE